MTFDEQCKKTHQEMGGRATAEEVALHVRELLTTDAYRHQTWMGFVSQVRSSLRSNDPDTGLPESPCIDGVYVQAALLTEDELLYLAAHCMKGSRRLRRRAQQWADQRFAIYGLHTDLDALGEETA